MLLLYLAVWACAAGAATEEGLALRGATSRRAQEEPPVPVNSMETVAPKCEDGYFDISQGKAYFWSCAFYCDGGKYYATAGCQCACLTPLQAAKLLEAATAASSEATAQATVQPTSAPTEEGATTAPAVSYGTIIVTSPPSPATTQPSAAGGVMTTFPVGQIGQGTTLPGVDDWRPSPGTPGPEAAPAARAPSRMPVETVLLAGVGILGGLCVLGAVMAAGYGLRRRQPKQDMPAITLYKPRDSAPQPSFELTVPGRGSSSRASSKSSTGSQRGLISDGPGSRRNSRESAGSLRDAGKASDLDALATASTNASNYSGIGSVNSSWAWGQGHQPQGDGTGSRHLSPQRPRVGSKCSTNSTKASRVQPDVVGERRASDSSTISIRDLEIPSWRRPSK